MTRVAAIACLVLAVAACATTTTTKGEDALLRVYAFPPLLDGHGKEICVKIVPCPLCLKMVLEKQRHNCCGTTKIYIDGAWYYDEVEKG